MHAEPQNYKNFNLQRTVSLLVQTVSIPLQFPLASHCLIDEPDWLNPSLHVKALTDPKVVSDIIIDPLIGAGSKPQSTTINEK